jgi:hypothetical protein
LFLFLFAVPLQAQETHEQRMERLMQLTQQDPDSTIAEIDRQMDGIFQSLTDIDMFNDMLAGRRSANTQGIIWWNRELRDYLQVFTDSTEIQVGITSSVISSNIVGHFLDVRRPRGTYEESTEGLFMLLKIRFEQSKQDDRQYRIKLNMPGYSPSIASAGNIPPERWGHFFGYLAEINSRESPYKRTDFRDSVTAIITRGLYILSGIAFPVEKKKDATLPAILFSKAEGEYNKFGYDDMNACPNTFMPSATGHYINVRENDHTYISVRIQGNFNVDNLNFTSNAEGIIFENKPNSTTDNFNLRVRSTRSALPNPTPIKVTATYQIDTTAHEIGYFHVYVFREAELTANVYHFSSTRLNRSQIVQDANKLLRWGVASLDIESYQSLQPTFDKNSNGVLDVYENVPREDPRNEELLALIDNISDGAIIVVDGINRVLKISETINIGSTVIKIPQAKRFLREGGEYDIINPNGRRESFFISRFIDNNTVEVRIGFTYEHVVTGSQASDPYIFLMSVGGFTTPAEDSPVIVSSRNRLYITIPHEILHKAPHLLRDVEDGEGNIMNFLYRRGTILNKPLRRREIRTVQTATGVLDGKTQKQWLEINNRINR